MAKLIARVLPFPSNEKHYGVQIGLFTDEHDRQIGNSLKIWYCSDEIGGNDASERETEKLDFYPDDHYEHAGDLAMAELICKAINDANVDLPDLPYNEAL